MLQLTPLHPEDEAFAYAVYASTRREEVAAWGWDEAQQNAFLRMQFQMQRRAYALQFPAAEHSLIVQDGQPVGRLIVLHDDQAIGLTDIALLPAFRGRGLGSAIIRGLQAEAAAAGKPLQLQVMKTNPARRLYERLGFTVCGETATHYAMQWLR